MSKSALGIAFYAEKIIPTMSQILEELDDFFANEICESVIISVSVYDYLSRTSFDLVEKFDHAYSD